MTVTVRDDGPGFDDPDATQARISNPAGPLPDPAWAR